MRGLWTLSGPICDLGRSFDLKAEPTKPLIIKGLVEPIAGFEPATC
jgi:hypothetical protein